MATSPRTARSLANALLSLACCAGALAAAPLRAAPADPVYVYYEGRGCAGDTLELQVYDRADAVWRPHPAHSRVRAGSCQVEDAGGLLNELRWRCRPVAGQGDTPWNTLDVFDADVMSRCAVGQVEPGQRRSAISVDAPREGLRIDPADPRITLTGSVRVDGVEGNQYDVVLLIDRSVGREALAAQVQAARATVRKLAPRLGAVRLAVVSYPDRSPRGEGDDARIDLPWSHDTAALDAALARLEPAPGPSSPARALRAALQLRTGERPAARPVFLIGIHGDHLDDPGAARDDDELLSTAAAALERGVELHWFSLGGLATEAPPVIRRTVQDGRGSFRRLTPGDYAEPFFESVALPVARSLHIENPEAGGRGEGAVDARGRFVARVPVRGGRNRLRAVAELSDGSTIERPFELVFDDKLLLLEVVDAERDRNRAARRKRLELEIIEE